MMARKLSFLLVAIFLCVQVLSLLHVAEYGFEKHGHNGRFCDIDFFYENQKIFDTPGTTGIPASVIIVVLTLSISLQAIRQAQQSYSAKPRAPPILSL